MLITIIVATLAVVGLIISIICIKHSFVFFSGTVSSFSFIALLFLVILIISSNIQVDEQHQKLIDERQGYILILQNDTEKLYLDTSFYDNIANFNYSISVAQKRSKSVWFNWFYNKTVYNGIEIIDLKEYLIE